MNGKWAFISERPDEFDTSNFLTIWKGDHNNINEPKSEDVNINNNKIINCNDDTNDNNVYTIKKTYSLLQERINFKFV